MTTSQKPTYADGGRRHADDCRCSICILQPKHAAPEGAEPKLRRSIESWRKCDPATIAAGSEAQCMYCIDDARADILALAAALTQANTEAARSKRGSKNAGQA